MASSQGTSTRADPSSHSRMREFGSMRSTIMRAARRLRPKRPYRGRDMQNKAYELPSFHLLRTLVNKRSADVSGLVGWHHGVSESPSEGDQVMTKPSSGTLRDLAIGAAAGYCASRVMDLATDWYFEHQSEASRRREEEIAPGGTLVLAGRWLAGTLGRDIT